MVIGVIGILAALLLPAVMAAQQRGDQTRQINEISQLSAALEGFRNQFGVYPPSRIRLREATAYRSLPGPTTPADPFDAMSVEWLRRIWPQIAIKEIRNDPATVGAQNAITTADPAQWMIWCQDDPNKTETVRRTKSTPALFKTYELEGDECLVFFLGGVARLDRAGAIGGQTPPSLLGFSRNPQSPGTAVDATFSDTIGRDGPFYDFVGNRLIIRQNVQSRTGAGAGSDYDAEFPTTPAYVTTSFNYLDPGTLDTQLPSYLPTKARQPFAYFSSYMGRGYRPQDCNFANVQEVQAKPQTTTPETFPGVSTATTADAPFCQIIWPVVTREPPSGATSSPYYTQSQAPNPYTVSRSAPTSVQANLRADDTSPIDPPNAIVEFHKRDTYQLIAPGRDGLFGPGGRVSGQTMLASSHDYDNLSNVSGAQTVGEFNSTLSVKN